MILPTERSFSPARMRLQIGTRVAPTFRAADAPKVPCVCEALRSKLGQLPAVYRAAVFYPSHWT